MTAGTRVCVLVVAAGLLSFPGARIATSQAPQNQPHPDVDMRDTRAPAAPRVQVQAGDRRFRLNRASGTARLLQDPAGAVSPGSGTGAIRSLLAGLARQLGLDPPDLATLVLTRDYTTRSNGVRHIEFSQVVDGLAVFDSTLAVHLRPDGTVARITSSAAPTDGRDGRINVSSTEARAAAISHSGGEAGPASQIWLPMDGALRLAWHVAVTAPGESDIYDVLIDAQTAGLLVRRNRVRRVEGAGRVLQSSTADPRQPDPLPLGAGGSACPPPANHVIRSLTEPFRDRSTVLAGSGRLEGNNVQVFRGNEGASATGTPDGSGWLFDYPFNSAGSAETFLFFALNFAHDFFYDLGFDEAAGNFQADNFGRGGLGSDPVRANARAPGRNNANYVHAADGSSPTINMFLWDGQGCWAGDVDGDGAADLDGDYDLDIILHEYHHGVSLRLNTAFTGNEAGAIGEGGSDFFAYTINGDTVLAEYSRPGGLRQVNGKHYGDWTCLLGLFCEVHDNGEIWANVLWDVRERFRTDLVAGSEAAAINESHQLYIDALSLSPPAPTMLDMRDAMVEADVLRSGGGARGPNFCRLWESFAARGMGVSATDTADNGFNQVVPAYDVPEGCTPPPAPPTITVAAPVATALEAGAVPGVLTISRSGATSTSVIVNYRVGGNATAGADYTALQGSVVIPAGASSADVSVVPIDDALVENNESVTLTLLAAGGYIVGTPSSATVSIVSDDVAPDLFVSVLTAPRAADGGSVIDVTDTTRNQGLAPAPASQTSFYLSSNVLLDAGDPFVGSRAVPELAPGASSTGSAQLTLPAPLDAGTYYVFAKSDGPGTISETVENNNTRSVTIAIGADLVVSSVTAPAAAAAGGTILVTDTSTNQGAGAAGASATRFYLSGNILLDGSDTPLQMRSVPQLQPGGSSTASTSVTIPGGVTAGTYYLVAQADATESVREANETNNAKYALVRIGPDLTVSALTAPARGGAGLALSLTETTRNTGAGSTGPSTTAFYLSSNATLDAADVRLNASRAVPALASNESSSGSTIVTIPDVASGTWTIIARADADAGVPETYETNNTRTATVRIGPDLSFLSTSAPTSGVAGSSISVSAVVRNTGGAAAPASVIRFYLSTNLTLDAGDLALGASRGVGPLAVDATDSGTTAVPLPPGVTGSMYLLVVADGDQNVAEASETNNISARFISIGG